MLLRSALDFGYSSTDAPAQLQFVSWRLLAMTIFALYTVRTHGLAYVRYTLVTLHVPLHTLG